MSAALQLPEPTALVVIPASAVSTIIAADKDDILGKLADKIAHFKADVSTPKGREEIASMGRQVSSSKVSLLKMADTLTEDAKRQVKAVSAEKKIIEERLDDLRDQVLQPLVEYRNIERDRIKGHEDALAMLQESSAFYATEQPAADVQKRLDYLLNLPERDWQEFKARASDVVAVEIDRTSALLARMQKREADIVEAARVEAERVELQRLADLAAREKREREIAERAAAEAKRQAEQAAELERQETLRAAAEERARAERAREESEQREQAARERAERLEAQAETRRVERHQRALASIKGMISDAVSPFNGSQMIRHITGVMDGMEEMGRNWEEFADQAAALIAEGRERIAARLAVVLEQEEARRQKDQQEAEQREAERQALAIESERQRVAAEAARVAAEEKRRAENVAHRTKINREALADLMKVDGLTEELGKAVIAAVAKGQIRHVGVTY